MTKNAQLFFLLALLLCAVFVLQLTWGSVSIPVAQIFAALSGRGADNAIWQNIVLESRLPGAVAAILAGSGLSVSGLQMQTMFRNPVAGPYVLGISAGASLGVALLLLAAPLWSSFAGFSALHSWALVAAAGIGATLIFLINFFISFRLNDVVAFLIIGLMIGAGISAFIEVLQYLSANDALKQYVLWTFGSFRYVNRIQSVYLAVIILPCIALVFLFSKQLNLLLLGDTYATSSGLNVQRTKLWIVVSTSLLAGGITAFCGPIGFVGLAVPHVARALFRTSDHKILLPAVFLIGAIITSACNIISALPGTDYALPVNAITALFGAPVVIWIIIRQKKIS